MALEKAAIAIPRSGDGVLLSTCSTDARSVASVRESRLVTLRNDPYTDSSIARVMSLWLGN